MQSRHYHYYRRLADSLRLEYFEYALTGGTASLANYPLSDADLRRCSDNPLVAQHSAHCAAFRVICDTAECDRTV